MKRRELNQTVNVTLDKHATGKRIDIMLYERVNSNNKFGSKGFKSERNIKNYFCKCSSKRDSCYVRNKYKTKHAKYRCKVTYEGKWIFFYIVKTVLIFKKLANNLRSLRYINQKTPNKVD